jgi:hypothetical protein
MYRRLICFQVRQLTQGVSVLLAFAIWLTGYSADGDIQGKPVPRMQAVPLPDQCVSFHRDGIEVIRYNYGNQYKRPFLFPVVGPAGRQVTRIGHPRAPQNHGHHLSVWIGHRDVNGVNFWEDRGQNLGHVVHESIDQLDDGPESAAIQCSSIWCDSTGKVLLREQRRISLRRLPSDELFITIDLKLTAVDGVVVLGKTNYGLIGVRVAKSMSVEDGGGMIRNSDGAINEKAVMGRTSRWVDYAGPVTATEIDGIQLLDHPQNPGAPTEFIVRDDGWMGVSLTASTALTIEPTRPLQVCYGLYVHKNQGTSNELEKRWSQFAQQQIYSFNSITAGK